MDNLPVVEPARLRTGPLLERRPRRRPTHEVQYPDVPVGAAVIDRNPRVVWRQARDRVRTRPVDLCRCFASLTVDPHERPIGAVALRSCRHVDQRAVTSDVELGRARSA